MSADGQTSAAIQQSFDSPPEVWAGKLGAWKQITHKNASLHPAWGKTVSLHWTTEIGSVQGWLTYPLDFDPAKKYPLVVCVHGGPSSAVTPCMAKPLVLLPGATFAGIFSAATQSPRQLRSGRSVHSRERERFRLRRFSGHYGRRG